MQKQSQPQTTSNSNVRDASVQISAARHTPGPWKADRGYSLNRNGQWQDFKIKGPDKKSICSCSPASTRDGKEIEGNAHLIAAAPELLEALEWIASQPQGYMYAEVREAARAAIAKAKGE